jgi:hypothetical protein
LIEDNSFDHHFDLNMVSDYDLFVEVGMEYAVGIERTIRLGRYLIYKYDVAAAARISRREMLLEVK